MMKRIAPLLPLILSTLACGMPNNGPGIVTDSEIVPAECGPNATRTGQTSVTITPSDQRGPNCYEVPAGKPLTLTWQGTPDDTTEVTFNLGGYDLGSATVLGTDDDASDGFSIEITLDADTPPSVIWAESDGGTSSDPIHIFMGD